MSADSKLLESQRPTVDVLSVARGLDARVQSVEVVGVVEEGATQATAAAHFGVAHAAVQWWVAKGRRERESDRRELSLSGSETPRLFGSSSTSELARFLDDKHFRGRTPRRCPRSELPLRRARGGR